MLFSIVDTIIGWFFEMATRNMGKLHIKVVDSKIEITKSTVGSHRINLIIIVKFKIRVLNKKNIKSGINNCSVQVYYDKDCPSAKNVKMTGKGEFRIDESNKILNLDSMEMEVAEFEWIYSEDIMDRRAAEKYYAYFEYYQNGRKKKKQIFIA